MGSLDAQIVLIFGASSGIGPAAAVAFAEAGAAAKQTAPDACRGQTSSGLWINVFLPAGRFDEP